MILVMSTFGGCYACLSGLAPTMGGIKVILHGAHCIVNWEGRWEAPHVRHGGLLSSDTGIPDLELETLEMDPTKFMNPQSPEHILEPP